MEPGEAEFKERFSLVGSNVKIFSGNAHPRLAYDICRYLGLPLGRSLASTFQNGETRVKIEETVRGKDVYIVQPICGRVNDSLVELLLMIDAVARASVKKVTAIIPYYGYEKQEKKTMSEETQKNSTLKDDELDAVVGGASYRKWVKEDEEDIVRRRRKVSGAMEQGRTLQEKVEDKNK